MKASPKSLQSPSMFPLRRVNSLCQEPPKSPGTPNAPKSPSLLGLVVRGVNSVGLQSPKSSHSPRSKGLEPRRVNSSASLTLNHDNEHIGILYINDQPVVCTPRSQPPSTFSWKRTPSKLPNWEELQIEDMQELVLDDKAKVEVEVVPTPGPALQERWTFSDIAEAHIENDNAEEEAHSLNVTAPDTPAATKSGVKSWFKTHLRIGASPSIAIQKNLSSSWSASKISSLQTLAFASDHPVTSRVKKTEYKMVKALGRGAQGHVSLQIHVETGTPVAIKSLSVAMSPVDVDVRGSFHREIALLKQASPCPSIIRLLDFWEGKGRCYQVFELCPGGDFDTGLPHHSPLSERAARHLFGPIAEAVGFLHSNGILHRDVRPANCFLRRGVTGRESAEELRGISVLADLGVACEKQMSGRIGSFFAKRPAYIAPEIVDGARFNEAADVFGLGVCLLRVLLGRAAVLEDQEVARWESLSEAGSAFLRSLLDPNPLTRLKSQEIRTEN
ncbi:kinase-like domain-containing protein [Chytriomyces sp. MP71]|nr:kinase-like domain-containing protein [Chytriomyces sp. MP71]